MGEIHGRNVASMPGAELAYCVDFDPSSAERLAGELGAKAVTADEAFASGDVDAFIIASPAQTHADYIERAVETGAYVLCEKPIDHELERAVQCLDKIGDKATKVQVGFNRRFDFHFNQLKQQLKEGSVGNIEQVLIISRDPKAPSVEVLSRSSGLLKETTIHDFDLARWLVDEEPAQVFVAGGALVNPEFEKIDHIDTSTTIMRTASGIQITILNSLRASYGYDQRIEVLGSKGMVAADNVEKSRVITADESGIKRAKPLWFYPQRYAEAYRTEVMEFLNAVSTKSDVTPNAFDGYRASLLANNAIESLKLGRWVKIARD
ncbi:MAG: Gfo/Idh/MocA family oxidoreductase [Rhodospirillales bacterium]|nr:Gfo/Idh/MocA family oxidoreductase [Rhodospirillales bacterium]